MFHYFCIFLHVKLLILLKATQLYPKLLPYSSHLYPNVGQGGGKHATSFNATNLIRAVEY